MVWVGEVWVDALASFGIEGEVHRQALAPSAWSRQVCWTGLGTGEVVGAVTAAGRAKLVGVSQRRTRAWARFQSMCHLRWRPELVAALVATVVTLSSTVGPSISGTIALRDAVPTRLSMTKSEILVVM